MNKTSYRIVNGITIYRILAAPVLFYLAFSLQLNIFKWLLPISYFTDLIDGFLARKLKVTSVMGSRLDSIGDDLTVLASLTGLAIFRPEFIIDQKPILIVLFSLFLIQIILAFIRYHKTTSFHTYFAKAAAIFQGTFLILIFLIPKPLLGLFYIAAGITFLELIEEIILVLLLPKWEINIKGLYWIIYKKDVKHSNSK